jgi:hypothetical protein
METKRAKRIILGLCLVTLISFVSTGCGDKDDPKPNKITMKFTLTVTGAASNDQVDFTIGAGNHDASQYGSPAWKINGQTQGNESVIQLDVQNFVGATKTYILETVKPFDFGSLSVGYSNADGGPLTISYKAEIGGNVETNVENLVVTAGQSQTKNFSYQAK